MDYLGKTLVVYEYVYRDGVLIAIHDDIDDDLQDIKFIETTSLALAAFSSSKDTYSVETSLTSPTSAALKSVVTSKYP